MDETKIIFSFGKNWEQFIKNNFSEEKVAISKRHILDFLELQDLSGKYFLDVGCGSGIHSLAALKAGAEKIVSFDTDPYSVKTTKLLKEMHGNLPHWHILHGSILDLQFISILEPADIVYAWGALHHTGDMYKAIENSSSLLKNNGYFYVALYTTDSKSEYWLRVKKRYNKSRVLGKKAMECSYIMRHLILPYCLRFKNPLKVIFNYKKKRGMSYFTDVKDWLGGYPFEHAKIEDVFNFCKRKLGLDLVNIKTGEANTEYLFSSH